MGLATKTKTRNELSKINRASLLVYLDAKHRGGTLNMSQYAAADAASKFLNCTVTRDNILGAMQKLGKKWPTKQAQRCRKVKEYNCSDPDCEFKGTSPAAVKAHYREFPLHAVPKYEKKKGRKMSKTKQKPATTTSTVSLEKDRITGKLATAKLSNLSINELRSLAGAMQLLNGGVGIGATKAEYTALIEAKRQGNKRGITIIAKKIARRNVAKKAARKIEVEILTNGGGNTPNRAAGRKRMAYPLTEAGRAARPAAAESKRGKRFYKCKHRGCGFDAGQSSKALKTHYDEHPTHRRANQVTTYSPVKTKKKPGPKPKKYRCHNYAGGYYHGPDGVFTEPCDFKATSGTGVRSHYVNGKCPTIVRGFSNPDPVSDIVQHRPEVAAEITVTKVDLDFCCNCQFDLTTLREKITGDYAVNFCPKCSMPLPSFSS